MQSGIFYPNINESYWQTKSQLTYLDQKGPYIFGFVLEILALVQDSKEQKSI